MGTKVGIHGIGVFLPSEVRRNDWWPPHVVARWMEARTRVPRRPLPSELSEGAARVLRAMSEQALDPFQSTLERRVTPADMSVLDMEERAAREALDRARIAGSEIDLLLTYTLVPDFQGGNPACLLHHRLGLGRRCFSMHTDVSSSAFMMQLTTADSMIRAGRARYALLVQSCIPSRLLDMEDPIAPTFGDAATAVVVGPVADDRGLESAVTFTDGSRPRTLLVSVPGDAWYAEGRSRLHIGDPEQMQSVFIQTADAFKDSVDSALAAAARPPGDVDFFCIHQGAPWLRHLVQEYVGLAHARSVETFARTAYIFASTLPAALALGEERGLLRDGDVVLLSAGGPGNTFGASVIRWGT